ncbi:subtilisin-like protease SBT1.7, partial [Tanacetum coccineum]
MMGMMFLVIAMEAKVQDEEGAYGCMPVTEDSDQTVKPYASKNTGVCLSQKVLSKLYGSIKDDGDDVLGYSHGSQDFRFSAYVLTFIIISITALASSDDYRAYIVLMDKSMMPSPYSNHHNWYTSVLSSLSNEAPAKHLYTYNHVMDGFSAVLTKSQLSQLENVSGFVTAFEETLGKLHTTHTPKFLGLKKHSGLWPISGFGDDMIIGILDTGIWPESESFHDKGMSEVPSRWRGACETEGFCNKKLIGARSFSQGMKQRRENISTTDDYDSPRDYEGHGTHTSSTASGSRVHADYFGYAKGTATGIAPNARLAMYKVLFLDNSYDAAASDTLAGMDQAIEDGVDLMSLSLGFDETQFFQNPIAIGAFAAMEKGIFVSCSAGNGGPHRYTLLNGAPWITTVGAERTIYYGYGNKSKENCYDGSLDPKDVKGKYVFCDDGPVDLESIGAAGVIFSSDYGPFMRPKAFNLPIVALEPKVGHKLRKYLISTKNASVSV